MIFFMSSFLLKNFAADAAFLPREIRAANTDNCILIDCMQKSNQYFHVYGQKYTKKFRKS